MSSGIVGVPLELRVLIQEDVLQRLTYNADEYGHEWLQHVSEYDLQDLLEAVRKPADRLSEEFCNGS